MSLIDLSGLRKEYGPTILLNGISFTVDEEDRIGFIGRNGCGKSTLFRIISGCESRDDGIISYKRGIDIGYLPQEPVLQTNGTVGDEIELSLRDIREKMTEYHRISAIIASADQNREKLLERQGEIISWIEHHGGWNTDYRIDTVLQQLRIGDRQQLVSSLSGGMKKRVALAGLILRNPSLLMLDEPTNHLDAVTIQWLEDYLKSYAGAVLLITHDRYFLDNIVTRMFELEKGALTCYGGSYSDYLSAKRERLLQEERQQSRLLNLFRIEEEWMRRGPKARGTKAKARIDRFSELEEKTDRHIQKGLNLKFNTDRRLGGNILEISYLTKSYNGRQIFRPFTLSLKHGDRIGIIGANGCGKSTLLRIVLGLEYPTSGSAVRGKNTRFSYFDQERNVLDPEKSVEDEICQGYWVTIGNEKRHKVGYLEEFLFEKHDHRKPVKTLSGGEKARLILAKLMLEGANLLILDEPTNDLDIPTLQLLDEALISFPGCILMATHDRFFLDKVATGILSFEEGGDVVFYEGNYETYKTIRRQEKNTAVPLSSQPAVEKRPKKEKKGPSYKERMELQEVEQAIDRLETRKRDIETILASPEHLGKDHDMLKNIGEEFNQIEKELDISLRRWEELSIL